MSRSRSLVAAGSMLALALGLVAVFVVRLPGAERPVIATVSFDESKASRSYGSAVSLGQGMARAYVVTDPQTGAPAEIGVALSEQAMDGLPTTGSGHHEGHAMPHTFLVELPEGHGTPFTFLEMNWNPSGHEPEGVYQDVPHFDFHFYTVAKSVRDGIVPGSPDFAAKANRTPSPEYIPASNAILAPPGAPPAAVAVPMMGVHWVDVRSHELQGLFGRPEAYKPFTSTFIHGSWDGTLHFWEPMITRATILETRTTTDPAVRDQVIAIPTPARYQTPGYYPTAYRIKWDEQAREYRIALTNLKRAE